MAERLAKTGEAAERKRAERLGVGTCMGSIFMIYFSVIINGTIRKINWVPQLFFPIFARWITGRFTKVKACSRKEKMTASKSS